MHTNEVLPASNNRILTASTLLKIDDSYYKIQLLYPATFSINEYKMNDGKFKFDEGIEFSDDIAYLYEDYFYLYRGNLSDVKGFDTPSPGIYYDDKAKEYIMVDPESDADKEYYNYADKVTSLDADEIRKAVLDKKVIIFNTPDSSHSTIPDETMEDDILKKSIKRAIKQKGIDLDQYKVRFASKNMLFNAKQVLRGNSRLSVLIFDRCAEALNLKYTIILEEGGGDIIGMPLDGKIVISSHDVVPSNIHIDSE